jgi:DNA polymerase III delta prime subunit
LTKYNFPLPKGGNFPHSVIITGGDGAREYAKNAAAALVCRADGGEGCNCGDCRRVREGIHPDVVTLDKGGSLIGVEDIRALRRDAFVAPLESPRKVYIIANADDMNPAAENAALKLLEEPPEGVFFMLLTPNPDALLETVRSRCVLITVPGGAETAPDEDAAALAENFAESVARDSEFALLDFCMQNEKLKRAQAEAFFTAALALLRDALRVSVGAERTDNPKIAAIARLPREKLVKMAEILLRRAELALRNVGVAHLMGTISAEYFGR